MSDPKSSKPSPEPTPENKPSDQPAVPVGPPAAGSVFHPEAASSPLAMPPSSPSLSPGLEGSAPTVGAPAFGETAVKSGANLGRRARWLRRAAIVLIPLVLLGGAYAANLYAREPKLALSGYLAKLATSKTGSYLATIDYKSGDTKSSDPSIIKINLGEVKLKLDGLFDLTDKKNPKTSVTVDGSVASYGGKIDVRELDKTLYLKLDSLSLLGAVTSSIGQDWYKTDLTSQSDTLDKCGSSGKGSTSLFGSKALANLPLKDVKLVSASESIAGHRTSHFSGAVDVSKLQKYLDDVNKNLSADCKITNKASDVADTVIKYDLWTSGSFDRLHIVANNSKDKSSVDATIDTSSYNKPVNITAPSGAKDINDLFGGGLSIGGSSSHSSASVSSRDTQRKSDLRSIQAALESYYANNRGSYPATLSVLTQGANPVLKKIPVDPTNKSPYVYGYVAGPAGCKTTCKSYTLTAKLESSTATGSDIIKGVYTLTSF